MKLGLNLGFLTSSDPNPVPLAIEAEKLGYDSVWVAEAWGSDAVSLLAWVGASTKRISLGTAILQIPSRTPALTAMTAATLDRLSGGRLLLGLGVSGPQVIEGWHGVPYGKPLTRTRETVEIVRRILARDEPLVFRGESYTIPAEGSELGKPLKLMMAPLRKTIPIYLAALGPKNVALAAEIADGWLPILYSPFHAGVFRESLDAGFAKRAPRYGLRYRAGSQGRDWTRPRAMFRCREAEPRALRRRHGRRGKKLLQRSRVPVRL